MAGMIFFTDNKWGVSSWLTFYVMEHLASNVDDAATKAELQELVENNIPMLDLSDPEKAPLVQIIIDDLPQHIPVLQDPTYQPELVELIAQLVEYAKAQKQHNRASAS
jgi:hypothetical protein